MVIGNTQRLKNFTYVHLAVQGDQLGRVTIFKYLEVIINETLTWHDHIDSIYSKVGQRFGLLKRMLTSSFCTCQKNSCKYHDFTNPGTCKYNLE